jgi:hypothetical protein
MLMSVCDGINYMTKRYCSEEDVRQTVNMTFFQCIHRYERKDSEKGPIPFSAFLYSYFFYLLKKNVDTFLIDQLGRKSFPLYNDNDSMEDENGTQMQGVNVDQIEYAIQDLIFADNVDEFWILGENTQPPFCYLSVQERQLIKWKYIDNKKSSEIALKITEHPNTVREHLAKIKDKLYNILKSDGMEEYLIISGIKED